MGRGFPAEPNNSQAVQPHGSEFFPPPYSVFNSAPAVVLPPAARSVPTVMGLLNALKRRWVLATFLGMLAALAAAAGFWLAAPTGKHQVKTIVEILPLRSSIDDRSNENDSSFNDFKLNQEVLIKTRTLVTKVAQDPKVAVLPMVNGSEDPVKVIQDYIETKWAAPSLLAVTMNGDQPEQLQTIMEVLVKKYIEQSKIDLQADREQRKKQIEKALEEWLKKYQSQKEFIDQMNNLNMSGSDRGGNEGMLKRVDDDIAECLRDISRLNKEIQKNETYIKVTQAQVAKPETIKPPAAILDSALDQDEAVRVAKVELDSNESVLQAAIKSAPDPSKSPLVDKYKAAVQASVVKLDEAKKTRRPTIEKSMAIALKAEFEKNLLVAIESLEFQKADLTSLKKQLTELEDRRKKMNKVGNLLWGEADMATTKNRVSQLKEQLDNINILMDSVGRIIEKEKPIVIPNPNIKQKMMFGAIIAIIAFVLVLVVVAFLEWRSRRVDSVDQVVNELNLRILGTIPAFPSRASLKAGEADMNQNWRFILNESVNSTRTMLLHSAKTQQMQVLMVTSAMQGEGKTSLASQLATSMATAGMRTLILDLDLRNPSMNRLFDLPLTPGVSEVLINEIDVSDAVQPTTVPNLWVVPAGQCSNRVIACLAQGHPIEALFNRLRGQFDFIVVDTCPVLPVADALLIGMHVDGVVFSILQDISQLPKVLNASERLAQLNIPLLGAVVNGIKTDVHAYGYNYVKQLPA